VESRRIDQHPILGPAPPTAVVTITVDGTPIRAREGDTVASALVAAGWTRLRRTEKRGEARGVFCANGKCTDCVMTVDGVPNVRTCLTPVAEGMRITSQEGLGEWRLT